MAWLTTACLVSTVGCGDPVRGDAIATLGAEDPAVVPGAFHRPNQPCLVCHDREGNAPALTVAGTVFRDPESALPVADVEILLADAGGQRAVVKSNCAGNFFLTARDFVPKFPLWVTVQRDGQWLDMESPMHRSGDCGACHQDPVGPAAAGHVFLNDDSTTWDSIPTARCY